MRSVFMESARIFAHSSNTDCRRAAAPRGASPGCGAPANSARSKTCVAPPHESSAACVTPGNTAATRAPTVPPSECPHTSTRRASTPGNASAARSAATFFAPALERVLARNRRSTLGRAGCGGSSRNATPGFSTIITSGRGRGPRRRMRFWCPPPMRSPRASRTDWQPGAVDHEHERQRPPRRLGHVRHIEGDRAPEAVAGRVPRPRDAEPRGVGDGDGQAQARRRLRPARAAEPAPGRDGEEHRDGVVRMVRMRALVGRTGRPGIGRPGERRVVLTAPGCISFGIAGRFGQTFSSSPRSLEVGRGVLRSDLTPGDAMRKPRVPARRRPRRARGLPPRAVAPAARGAAGGRLALARDWLAQVRARIAAEGTRSPRTTARWWRRTAARDCARVSRTQACA